VGNADIGSGGTGSQRGREFWMGSGDSGISIDRGGRLMLEGSAGRGRSLRALCRRARRMCGLRCRSASLVLEMRDSLDSSKEVHVDKRNDVWKEDGVVGVDQDESVKRLEEDEYRLSSSSMVSILLAELRLELTGRGPCRQLPVRRRDIVEDGKRVT